jgi:YaaC-like Protein
MAAKSKPRAIFREGPALVVGRETVFFGRNAIIQTESGFTLQHRLFTNDPWAMIAEGIHRVLPKGRTRDIAHSFQRQAEDYFRAATAAHELAVRPLLLYYGFLNISKAYAVTKGNRSVLGRSFHGVTAVRQRAIRNSLVRFESTSPARPGVFQELLRYLDGNPAVLLSDLRLYHLLPQILPGHRLWCYAAHRSERFLPIDHFQVRHSRKLKQVWLNIFLTKNSLAQIRRSETRALSEADLASEFEVAGKFDAKVCFQQILPESYNANPAEALARIIGKFRNRMWETARIATPYRKPYVYCCPPAERNARLPQMLSVYLLMFFLGSITRYFPLYFDDLLESRYGPLVETFLTETPMQFLYLMASEILGREVSKPAII